MPWQPPLHVCSRSSTSPMPSRTAGTAGGVASSFRTSHGLITRPKNYRSGSAKQQQTADPTVQQHDCRSLGAQHTARTVRGASRGCETPGSIRIEVSASLCCQVCPPGSPTSGGWVGASVVGTRSIPAWMTPPPGCFRELDWCGGQQLPTMTGCRCRATTTRLLRQTEGETGCSGPWHLPIHLPGRLMLVMREHDRHGLIPRFRQAVSKGIGTPPPSEC